MTIKFTARAVGVDEDTEIECLTAGGAEEEDGTGMVLLCRNAKIEFGGNVWPQNRLIGSRRSNCCDAPPNAITTK